MTTQTTRHSAETVAAAFVNRYYRILQKCIDQAYRFYKEKSILSWPLPKGEIKSVKTFEEINEFIISSHFKDNKVEVTSIDSQSSAAGGVLVVVTACLIGQDDSRKRFSQTFFLAPQETGYYVLNDVLKFVGVEESSTVIEEKFDENTSVAPLATENKVGEIVKKVSDKSETKVTTDDQASKKPSIISSEKEKLVAEAAPVVQNEAPKLSYASMVKQDNSSPSSNAPYKTARVVADVGLTSTSKKSQASGLVQGLTSSSNDKSIYIGGLPTNTTRSDLYAIVKEFGLVHTHDVQLKTYEDGYCCGFVHFQDEVSAQNAVQAHHIIVKGREAYIRFKRLNKGRDERANSPSNRGGFGNSGYQQQQNYNGRGTKL